MGTSSGYGGSAGAKPVRDPIQQWIGEPAGHGPDNGGDSDGTPSDVPPPETDRPSPGPGPPVPTRVLQSLSALGRLLAGTGGAGGGGGGGGGVGGRDTRKAAVSGALAVSAGYGSRGGADQQQAFFEHNLRPEDLDGLGPMEQALRIKEGAAPDGDRLDDDEVNQANCNFAIWIVEQGTDVAPDDAVRRWLVEYTWIVWQRETGQMLCELDAQQRRSREGQMRAVLENRMALTAIDMDGVTPADFQAAIQRALDTLDSIFDTNQQP